MKQITTAKNILSENSDILKDFFKDIDKYKIYSGEEQIEFARQAKAGDENAREKLITSNLRFVVTCAKHYCDLGVPLIDLIQAGTEGLIQSIENFDPAKGYKFLSFAVWYIRRQILKEIYNTGKTIRYPITYISNITKVKKAHDDFEVKNQREPTEEELINLVDLTQKQYKSTIINKSYCQSLDVTINEDETTSLSDLIPDSVTPYSDVFTKDAISQSLKCLNSREYKVITEFYGVDGIEERPIKEIAKEMNLGDERVRQLKKSGIKKLKLKCGNILKSLL